MGDLSAKVMSDNNGYKRIMGIHGLGIQNVKTIMEKDCKFCQTNGLGITGSLFPHKNIHKATWISSNGRARNQIDQRLINGQWRSVLDT